ncbi:hypothetical protein E4634_18665 [Mangrovimicrobium sediminis]|uniref:Uncharacterized protein n=1 Tax=Mangrovimicrobium sediminis TaxID=2562682 RepID=A0A4Z0LVT0_9GAMM|nr:hypothetical protein [Haliea sp. SAOS-164]TGD71297.1 hypothetical protein E4634_18665 [Haliea sp. SAOS-164]
MTACFQFAFSSPVEGMEAEFQRWYSDEHLPHSVRLLVVEAGQRFARVEGTPWPAGRHHNLVIWELAGDPATAIETLLASHGTQAMPISPAIDMSSVQPPTMRLLRRFAAGAESEPEPASRGQLLLAFLNPAEGADAAFESALLDGGLREFAGLPGAGATSLWTLTEAQLRGSARKYRYLLMFEADDSAALVDALTRPADRLAAIPHGDAQRMFAALFEPLTPRVAA